jgi:hypothetical protein
MHLVAERFQGRRIHGAAVAVHDLHTAALGPLHRGEHHIVQVLLAVVLQLYLGPSLLLICYR